MPKKTRIEVKLTRKDVLTVAAAAVGSAIVAPLVTTGPLSPFGLEPGTPIRDIRPDNRTLRHLWKRACHGTMGRIQHWRLLGT